MVLSVDAWPVAIGVLCVLAGAALVAASCRALWGRTPSATSSGADLGTTPVAGILGGTAVVAIGVSRLIAGVGDGDTAVAERVSAGVFLLFLALAGVTHRVWEVRGRPDRRAAHDAGHPLSPGDEDGRSAETAP